MMTSQTNKIKKNYDIIAHKLNIPVKIMIHIEECLNLSSCKKRNISCSKGESNI